MFLLKMFQNSKENENTNSDSKYSVMDRATKSGQLDMSELEYMELRELVEESLHLYKSSVDAHNHTLTHLRRVQRELDEKKDELEEVRRDFNIRLSKKTEDLEKAQRDFNVQLDQRSQEYKIERKEFNLRIDGYTRLVADQKLNIRGLKEREAFLVKNFRNGKIDEENFLSEEETRFGHQIRYDDIPELVKIFEDDALMVKEIDILSHVLHLSQASKSNMALTTFPNIYVKWLTILEGWVGQNGRDATYEKLVKGLQERNLTVVVEKVEKVLMKKKTDWPALMPEKE